MTSILILLTIRNASHYMFRENQNTLYVQMRVSEKRASYEIMWKYMVETDSSQMTMQCIRIAC